LTPEDRAWEIVRLAFEERAPAAPRARGRSRLLVAAAAAAVCAVVLAAVSPPGRAVFHRVGSAVGLAHADPALFSLPGGGRLLVVSAEHGGVWLVRADGYKRKLGPYDDATWSPHGRFVIATRGDRLVALDADGDEHWTLRRRSPTAPLWEGTATDTRIAYGGATGLRVVAGDGTGDHLVDRFGGPAAWDPARLHTLAYFTGGSIVLRRDRGPILWRRPVGLSPTRLEWSDDGEELAVFGGNRVAVLDANGHPHRSFSMLSADLITGAFRPGSHDLALVVRYPARSEVRLVDADGRASSRLLFAGPGDFGDLAWSPGGSSLLVTWPAADQWVFLRGARAHAVANIEQEFRRADGQGPVLLVTGRWCCDAAPKG
jgi:hypothetical protein